MLGTEGIGGLLGAMVAVVGARKRDVESFLDPDIREFETVLEGSRLYVLTALFIASQGASWVLLKVSHVDIANN